MMSIAAALSTELAGWLALAPGRIWRGEVWPWRPDLREHLQFSGELAPRWDERRLRRFMIEALGGTAVVTTLLALIAAEVWHRRYFSGWAACDVLVIAWARQYPDSILVLYGMVRLNGRNLITVVIGITCAYAIFAGPLAMAPSS
jgi:hypothetical protein